MFLGAIVVLGLVAISLTTMAQDIPADYRNVLQDLGRKGDFAEGVLKVGIPRNDIHVSVEGIALPTSFGFGGWVAFTKGDGGMDVMMGDLVLLQNEVNPVMSALLNNGLEVTALHNHFFWEEPRIFYMHVHGHGQAADLAHRIKPALDLIGHVSAGSNAMGKSGTTEPLSGTPDAAQLNAIIGHNGTTDGGVYKVVIGRSDIDLTEMGAKINARMGLNTWAAIVGSTERSAIAGDVAMKEDEVNGVLKALRANGLNVVAIHHHMIGGTPMVIFLHYWGIGPAKTLANGFKAALGELGKSPAR